MSAALRMAELIEDHGTPDNDNLIVFLAAVFAPMYGRIVSPAKSPHSYCKSFDRSGES